MNVHKKRELCVGGGLAYGRRGLHVGGGAYV